MNDEVRYHDMRKTAERLPNGAAIYACRNCSFSCTELHPTMGTFNSCPNPRPRATLRAVAGKRS